jgi:hypothetical protein
LRFVITERKRWTRFSPARLSPARPS